MGSHQALLLGKVLCHGGATHPGMETAKHQGKTPLGMCSAKPSQPSLQSHPGDLFAGCGVVLNAVLWGEVSASWQLHGDRERECWEECTCWIGSYHTKQDNITLPTEASREEFTHYRIIKVGKAL